jgi:hypothetical protein
MCSAGLCAVICDYGAPFVAFFGFAWLYTRITADKQEN